MIKKFEQYNESLRDKMTPKSDEELKKALDAKLDNLKTKIYNDDFVIDHDPDRYDFIQSHDLIDIIRTFDGIDSDEDIINFLLNNNIPISNKFHSTDAEDLLDRTLNFINNDEHTQKIYMKKLIDVILDNKDKINPSGL